jgi:hypothetical protein
MTTPKTPAQRVQALRQRRAELGLVRLDLYAHHEDAEKILALAEKLQAKREKAAKKDKPPDPSYQGVTHLMSFDVPVTVAADEVLEVTIKGGKAKARAVPRSG